MWQELEEALAELTSVLVALARKTATQVLGDEFVTTLEDTFRGATKMLESASETLLGNPDDPEGEEESTTAQPGESTKKRGVGRRLLSFVGRAFKGKRAADSPLPQDEVSQE